VVPEYALKLPTVQELLAWNDELRHFHAEQEQRVKASASQRDGPEGSWPVSPQDQANLYHPAFQRPGGGIVDLAGLTEVEKYEEALSWLHPERASQWWSWFRVCGVTFRMLEKFGRSEAARSRIWKAHHTWSKAYAFFNEEENVEQVLASRGRNVSGFTLLLRLLRFDNPHMEVRESSWQWQLGHGQARLRSAAPKAKGAPAVPALSAFSESEGCAQMTQDGSSTQRR
jgi:hypothetical protein